jgi:prephenate dehydrogenase
MGAITAIAADVQSAVADAELVIVCAPVDHIVEQVRSLAPHCRPGTLITDAGSTKLEIVEQLEQAAAQSSWPANVVFIGSHPLAGNEKQGPAHADADLLVGRTVVVTPPCSGHAEAAQAISRFWEALGARVVPMSAAEHDQAVAATSHLPHLAASAVAAATPASYLPLTARGWLDTTRIAAGDPALWRQIMLANRQNLLAALERYERELARIRESLESQDGAALEGLLDHAKHIRDAAGNRHDRTAP